MNTTPKIVKAASVEDFLSTVPALLGYTPHRSLVVVPFIGNYARGAMRVDLPDVNATTAAVTTMIGLTCRIPDVTGLAAVVYTEQDAASTRDVLAEMTRRANECGLNLVDALYVAADGWGSTLTDDAPRPLTEIVTPDDLASQVQSDQGAGAHIPVPEPKRAATVAAALAALDLSVGFDLIALIERAASTPAEELPAEDAAAMIAVLARPALRDVALVQWVTRPIVGAAAWRIQKASERGEEVSVAAVAAILLGQGPRPDATRLIGALDLARHVAAIAPGDDRAGALAAAAWLSWALGRSTHAAIYAGLAREIDPDHVMAGIVTTMVNAGHLPPFAFLAG